MGLDFHLFLIRYFRRTYLWTDFVNQTVIYLIYLKRGCDLDHGSMQVKFGCQCCQRRWHRYPSHIFLPLGMMRRAGFLKTTGYIPHLERTAENDLEAVRRILFQIFDPLELARCATNLNHTTECDIPLLSARQH